MLQRLEDLGWMQADGFGSLPGKKQPADPPLFGAMDEDESSKQEYFVERRFADPAKSLADSPPVAKPAVAAATLARSSPATAPATSVMGVGREAAQDASRPERPAGVIP